MIFLLYFLVSLVFFILIQRHDQRLLEQTTLDIWVNLVLSAVWPFTSFFLAIESLLEN